VKRLRSLRVLIVTALLSVAVHAMVFSGTWLSLPEREPDPAPLRARIVSLPPPVAQRAPEPVQARRGVRHAPTQQQAPPPVLASSASSTSIYNLPAEADAPVEETQQTPPAAAAAAEPVVVATAQPTTLAPELAPVRRLPKKGRITYTLYFGMDKFSAGRTVQTWEVEGDTYKIGSLSETTGVVDVFRSERRTYLSQGTITPEGLRPRRFLLSRIRRGETNESLAQFDWTAGSITVGRIPERRAAPLPPGSQDLVSFMYQLSLQPPAPGRMRVPVTTGSSFETYELDVLPEEVIDTPLGALKAVPVKQVARPGAESIQIWLASEFRYLPVQIRFFNREGEPAGEQVVSEIRISEQ
jgi:hypothetical protein